MTDVPPSFKSQVRIKDLPLITDMAPNYCLYSILHVQFTKFLVLVMFPFHCRSTFAFIIYRAFPTILARSDIDTHTHVRPVISTTLEYLHGGLA
jgi:hypothetical protein